MALQCKIFKKKQKKKELTSAFIVRGRNCGEIVSNEMELY